MPKCNFYEVALLCNFIEIALRHGCSSVNLLNIFRTPFLTNTSSGFLLIISYAYQIPLEIEKIYSLLYHDDLGGP